jgi:hypothetical protein
VLSLEGSLAVVPGLVPGTPLRRARCRPDRDGRDKPGHDSGGFVSQADSFLHLSPFFTGRGRRAFARRVRGRAQPLTRLGPAGPRHPLPVKDGEREERGAAQILHTRTIDIEGNMPMLGMSCSSRGVAGDVPRTEQR